MFPVTFPSNSNSPLFFKPYWTDRWVVSNFDFRNSVGLDNGYAECLEGMRWTRLQRLILLPCNEQVRAANNRLLLIQRQIFEILDFMGPMGKVGRGDLSTSSHSAFRRSTTRISAELSGPRLVQGADKEINKIRRKSCLVSKKRTTQLNFSSQFLNPSYERNARGYIFHN